LVPIPSTSAITSWSRARRVHSRIFLARVLLVLDSIRDVLDALLTTLAPPDRWVAGDHDALLADGAGGG
jgi:hypothetical protein